MQLQVQFIKPVADLIEATEALLATIDLENRQKALKEHVDIPTGIKKKEAD